MEKKVVDKKPTEKKAKPTSRSTKAGLQFPVGRIHRLLKRGKFAPRIGAGAPVFMAAVIEYMIAEILELAGSAATDNKKQRILPRHIQLAIRSDVELNKYMKGVTLHETGLVPHIEDFVLQKKKKKI